MTLLLNFKFCYSIVYHYNGTQWYKQFSQVGRLYWAFFECIRIFILHGSIYYLRNFLLPFSELRIEGLTDCCLSVLRQCWLGRLTHKIVPEMTYNESGGTLKLIEPMSMCVWQASTLRTFTDASLRTFPTHFFSARRCFMSRSSSSTHQWSFRSITLCGFTSSSAPTTGCSTNVKPLAWVCGR